MAKLHKNTVAEKKTLVLSRSKRTFYLGLMFIITLLSMNLTSAFNFTDGSLVAYYPLNETTGTVRDVSMTGHTGQVSNAFNFDGVKDEVDTNYAPNINPSTQAYSFALWAKPFSSGNTDGIIGTDIGTNQRFYFGPHTGDKWRAVFGASTNYIESSANININEWTFIVVTTDGAGNAELFINGSSEGTQTTGSYTTTGNFFLGNLESVTSWFNGSIDEVGVWTKELSGTEITSLYNSGNGKSYTDLTAGEKTNLISYYSLDEVGSDPLDSHGSNNGTLSGGTISPDNNDRGATGIIEQAVDFDGSTTYVTRSHSYPPSSVSTEINLSAFSWVKTSGTGSQVIQKFESSSSTQQFWQVLTEDRNGYTSNLVFNSRPNGDSGAGQRIVSDINIGDGDWHYIGYTINEGSVTLYLDNVSVGTGSLKAGTYTLDRNSIGAGYLTGSPGPFFDGIIDEVGIWNRALNSTEISELYNSGAGLAYDGGAVTTPTVTLGSPTNGTTISDIGTNFTVSGNEQSGFTWANVTYYVWSENGSLHNSTTVDLGGPANFTNTLFIDDFTLGEYTWNAEGCYNGTSDGCSSGTNRTLIVGASVQNQTFSNSTYETSTEDFNASITLLPGVVIQAAYLYYDGTKYIGTVTSTGSDNYNIGISLDIPLTPVAENKTWFWNFVYTSPTQREQNGTAMNQTVNPITFAECNATLTTLVLNMTIKEEGTFGLIDSNLEFNADYWLGDGDILKNLAFSNTDENKSNFQFCTSNTEDLIIDDIISYWSTDYERREYFLSRATLNNNTMNLNLYLLNTSTTDTFTVKVQDENDADVSGAFVYVQRWDIGTGNFHTIGMVKTSSDGSGILNLRLTDAWYRFQVNYNSILYLTTEPKKESTTSRTLKIDLTEDNPYALFEGVSYSLTFDETTNLSVFTYSDPTGSVQVGCLKVLKMEGSGNTQEYYSCVESTAGTLSYQIPDDGTYIIRAIFRLGPENDNLETVIDEIIRRGTGERFQVTGTFGQFISLMITGTMAAVGIAAGSIPLGLALIFISLVAVNLLGWLNISSSVLYGLLTVLILIGFSLRRSR